MDLTPDQVLQQLQTRGFESGAFRSPLRHFKGKLQSITGSMVQRGNMPQAKLEVLYNFVDLNVIESTEPYTSPIAQINIMHSNRIKSNMGVLGASIDKIINAGLGDNVPQDQVKNQDFLIGKVQEWKVTPGHMMWDGDKQAETSRECFEVISVDGVGSAPVVAGAAAPVSTAVTATMQALNLLDGKTQQEWNNLVFQDPLVKSDGDLTNNIVQGNFLPPLEATGIVTKDGDGIYHVVKTG